MNIIKNFIAVPIEESSELLSGNIGETPEMDNTEINSETKESESSYSVEVETMNKEYLKLLNDPIYFIENYCLVNNKQIKLSLIKKKFIEYNTSKSARHPN